MSLFASACLTALAMHVSGCTPGQVEGPEARPGADDSASHPVASHAGSPRDGEDGLLGVLFMPGTQDVSAEVQGVLKALPRSAGERFRKGEMLARIALPNPRIVEEARATVEKADAQRRKAAVELSNLESKLARALQLGDSIAFADLEVARAQAATARQELDYAEAAVRQERARLEATEKEAASTVIMAASDGVVALRLASPGSYVHVGDPLLRVIPSGGIWVRFAVPELVASNLVPSECANLQVSAGGLPSMAAVLRHIAPEVDADSRMVFAEAELVLPSTAPRLLAGAEARVRFGHTSPCGSEEAPAAAGGRPPR